MSVRIWLGFSLWLIAFSASAQWMDISSHRKDISFDGNVGYMAGDDGTILKSTDNGQHWQNISNPFLFAEANIIWDPTEDVFFIKTFINGQIVVACSVSTGMQGSRAKVAFSHDGGATWTVTTPVNSRDGRVHCYFKDQLTGWLLRGKKIVGGLPVTLQTVDGGATWTEVPELVRALDINFYDARNGWALLNIPEDEQIGPGPNQVVYRTTNGGESWEESFKVNFYTYYERIHAIDDTTAWIFQPESDSRPAIVRTIDAGETWDALPISNFGSSFAMANGETGWMIDNYGDSLRKTSDGGDSWNVKYFVEDDYYKLTKVEFINHNDGFLIGNNGFLATTNDGGDNWEVVNYCRAGHSSYPITDIYLDEDRSWLITENEILYSDVNRMTWDILDNIDLISSHKSEIDFAGNEGIMVGDGFHFTHDNGDNWERIAPTGANFYALGGMHVYMRGDGVVWFSSADGQIFKSVNGGLTQTVSWTPPLLGPSVQFHLAFSRNDKLTFAYTPDFQRTMISDDGGVTWTVSEEWTPVIFFLNNFIGWKMTETDESPYKTTIYKTTDGGKTWTAIAENDDFKAPTYIKWTLRFVDEKHGWFLIDTRLFSTTDGGETWAPEPTGVTYDLNTIETYVDINRKVTLYAGGTSVLRYLGDLVADPVDPNEPDPVTGLEDLTRSITVYPNPATDKLYVSNPVVTSISIADAFGKQMIVSDKTSPIDISNLAPGIYFVTAETSNGRVVSKIMKR